MATIIAKYTSGTCAECDSPIKQGDEIAHSSDGYVHVECPETELDLLAAKPACPSCWLVGPCDCD